MTTKKQMSRSRCTSSISVVERRVRSGKSLIFGRRVLPTTGSFTTRSLWRRLGSSCQRASCGSGTTRSSTNPHKSAVSTCGIRIHPIGRFSHRKRVRSVRGLRWMMLMKVMDVCAWFPVLTIGAIRFRSCIPSRTSIRCQIALKIMRWKSSFALSRKGMSTIIIP